MCIRDRVSVARRPSYAIGYRVGVAVDIVSDKHRKGPRRLQRNDAAEFQVPKAVSYTHLDVYKRQILADCPLLQSWMRMGPREQESAGGNGER